jgi:hypothetical protein
MQQDRRRLDLAERTPKLRLLGQGPAGRHSWHLPRRPEATLTHWELPSRTSLPVDWQPSRLLASGPRPNAPSSSPSISIASNAAAQVLDSTCPSLRKPLAAQPSACQRPPAANAPADTPTEPTAPGPGGGGDGARCPRPHARSDRQRAVPHLLSTLITGHGRMRRRVMSHSSAVLGAQLVPSQACLRGLRRSSRKLSRAAAPTGSLLI